jgi:2-polyprenyl-6-methoxyphenol hydroxylase-like FAD-dependent oxidoreductase
MSESAAMIFDRLGAAEPPANTTTLFGTAVVMGGSIAGLLAARVLADHAEQVVIVERDELRDSTAARAGVPQSAQVHNLLPGGRVQLDRWFEGFSKEALAEGAMLATPDTFRAYYNGRLKVRTTETELLVSSRPFIESLIRRRTTALPNVGAVAGRAVGVEFSDDRVVGVRYENSDGTTAVQDADFVVDAMGRSSRLGDWLERQGWAKPPMQRMNIDLNYTTGYFRRTSSSPDVVTGIAIWEVDTLPEGLAPAAISAVEGDRWMIMFGGYGDTKPGRTPEEFRRICAGLPDMFRPGVEDELLGDIVGYTQADSRRRDFHLLDRFPRGLVAVGDAVASFNPIYGQGMSSAALHASCLSEYLRSGPSLGPARDFFALQRVVVDSAWQTSAIPDLALPHIDGPYPRGYKLAQRVVGQIVSATVTDAEIARRFNSVTFMRAHPDTLAKPGTVLRAIRANRRDRRASR